MSGAEILGIISSAITLVDASGKLYRAAKDKSEFPRSFEEIAGRLPLIQDTLHQLRANVAEDSKQPDAFVNAAKACSTKAAALNEIFESVRLKEDASTLDGYTRAMKTMSLSHEAHSLIDRIRVDLQLLTDNRLLRQGARATSAARERGKSTHEYVTFSNSGSGHQFNQTKSGHQTMNFGAGPQINGEVSGPLYFTTSQSTNGTL